MRYWTAQVVDGWNFLRKGTPLRGWNALLLVASYLWARISRQATHRGMPLSISIEPTTSCNLRCPECPSGLRSFTRPTGMLPQELYRQTLDELHPTLWYLLFYFQGEPYLHPQFLEMVAYAASKKIYTATSTNGHYLSDELAKKTVESGLDRLIISIDGTTQDTYEQYRIGGQLEKVLSGTKRIVAWKKKLNSRTPHIMFQFLVVRPNEHQVKEVYQLARDLGVNQVVLKTAQIYQYQHGSPLIPTIDRYSRYQQKEGGTWEIKNGWRNQCWKMWHSCVITWDGKVVPCCFDKDAHHMLGHVGTHPFHHVWQGPAYQAFRQKLLHSRSEIEMCKNCTEGTRVWA
jgi:radical SAM protein with 4Fe4S-binding SPASM domain